MANDNDKEQAKLAKVIAKLDRGERVNDTQYNRVIVAHGARKARDMMWAGREKAARSQAEPSQAGPSQNKVSGS